ncbi:MAG: hypothetical protein ABI591_25650 [Kofleriaceae bacterium]
MQQILVLVLLASCSLIYDPSKIHAGDGRGSDDGGFADAPVDTPYVTADPSMVHASDLQPPVIYEGQGVDNSRPAVLTIRGVNFASGATVAIAPTHAGDIADLTLGMVVVAADANSLAVPITANIMTTLGAGVGVPLTITITEAGFTTTIAWTEVALDELTAVTQLPPTQQRYSRVALAAAGSLPTGGPRVTIHSMSSISLAAFHADALTTAPGAGGCNGGPPLALGACPGDGGAGADAASAAGVPTPGGGAGFSAKGGDGGPGTGGPIVGDRYVASYGDPANVASGGGNGGSTYLLPGNGGSGGAGGGTLELHAEGDLTTAALTALGGAGTAGTGATGGGGAGGLVILRTGHTLAVASVDVTGGLGGSSLATNAGSPGRVRVDAALGSVASAQQGPAFAIFTPVITDQHTLAIDLRLPSQIAFKLSRLDQRGVLVYLPDVMSGTGTATVDVPLINGWNKLCLTVPGGLYEDDIANECIELAFMN